MALTINISTPLYLTRLADIAARDADDVPNFIGNLQVSCLHAETIGAIHSDGDPSISLQVSPESEAIISAVAAPPAQKIIVL